MALSEDIELPVPKRPKLESRSSVAQRVESRLFAPFRTIGLVSPSAVPFTAVQLGTTTFQITTSVGRSIQTYDLRSGLNLIFSSRPQCPANITAIHAHRDRVFLAWGGGTRASPRGLWVMKRGQLVGELDMGNTKDQEISEIIGFGAWIIACGSRAVEVWRRDTYEHYTTILPGSVDASRKDLAFCGRSCTLPTFMNKLFIGCSDGSVDIYNISTGRLIHNLRPPSLSCGSVSALTAGTAIGLLAVAYQDGSVVLIDVENEEKIIQLHQPATPHPVTSITFRTDGAGAGADGKQEGVMATASVYSGDITLWDLNQGGRVAGILRRAHEVISPSQASGINRIEFLPGQAVIVSSGVDNSLRSWVCEQSPFSAVPRPLHSRGGHAAAVNHLRFLPAASDGSETAGKWLLSAAQDRSLWGFSLRKDAQSNELSQGNIKHRINKRSMSLNDSSSPEHLKASSIISMACSLNRDGGTGAVGGPVWANSKVTNAEEASATGWESIVTAHQGDRLARTWFWGKKRAGRWTLETGDGHSVSSVAITTCGTFALVGSSGGSLDMYNLQSGIHRQRFPSRAKSLHAKQSSIRHEQKVHSTKSQRGHSGSITGVVVDTLNQTVVSSALDGVVIFWDFTTGTIVHEKRFDSMPTSMRYCAISGLLSISCEDSCIRIIDIETRRTARELWGCVGQIYDHCFSHDGRWLIASSMDSVIRVFDLATGHLIDAFKTATCTSLAVSSTGEFLATAHAGSVGINIWNNKTLFTHIPSRQVNEEEGIIDLSSVSEFEISNQLSAQDGIKEVDLDYESLEGQFSPEQLNEQLLTLSITPISRWQTLLNLDKVRERNKPVQPPQKPKAAPFFLGSMAANGTTDLVRQKDSMDEAQQAQKATADNEESRVSRLVSIPRSSSTLSILLGEMSEESEGSPGSVIAHLTSLNPSAADLEIRSLTLTEMAPFVRTLTKRLRQRQDFELVNTWMSVFLKIHAEFVVEVDAIRDAALDFKTIMDDEETRLSELVGWGRGVVNFLRSAR